jgi:hypothetical protein
MIDYNEWKTETSRMHKYGESKTTRIVMAKECRVISCPGLSIF